MHGNLEPDEDVLDWDIEDMKKSMEVFNYIEHNNKNRFITKRITKISRKNNFFNELFSI